MERAGRLMPSPMESSKVRIRAFISRPAFLTLSEPEFQGACRHLARTAQQVDPDLIVGLASGGVYVAEAMRSHFPASDVVAIRLRRPSTAAKQSMHTEVILRRLPRRLSYLLRWAEVELREFTLKRKPSEESAVAQISDPSDLDALRRAERVLVVDDTVDSGRTLQAADKTIRRYNERGEIYTAVIASTWRKPPVAPDFLSLPRTLVRFPWSLDV